MKGLQTAHLDAVPWSASTLENSTGDRNHDLSATFASRALALGESLSMIGKLLGHNKMDTTSRYAHLRAEFHQGVLGASDRQHRRGHSREDAQDVPGVRVTVRTSFGPVRNRNLFNLLTTA